MFAGTRRALISPAKVTASAVSPQVAQFLARSSGMNALHVNAFTALIDGLVTDNVWTLLDALYVPATDTKAHAKLNLVSSSYTIVETGTVTWTADIGFSPTDADTANYLNSTFNPSTAGGNYTLNSGHISVWCNTDLNSTKAAIGGNDASNEAHIYPRNGAGDKTFYGRMNNANFSGGGLANATTTAGQYVVSRTGSTALNLYKNGSLVQANGTASTAIPNVSFAVVGTNANGTFSSSGQIVSALSAGGSLDATKTLALYNRLSTYRTAVGLP